MTNYWFTADTHFGHKLIADLRGFRDSVSMHDESLISAWNERVKPGDIVYHLGDFMLPQRQDRCEEILKKLHGTKHFCEGNHDTNQVLRAKGWASVACHRRKRINGQLIVMGHYALRTWQGNNDGVWNLYGHSHGQLQPIGKAMDVGVDCSPNFAPFNFDEIGEIMKWQAIATAEWNTSNIYPGKDIVSIAHNIRIEDK